LAYIFVSPLGNDTTGDGSILNPYLTIGKAVGSSGVATPGDTVYLRGGIYPLTSRVSFGVEGTTGNYITVTNYDDEPAKVDGSSIVGNEIFYILSKDYLKINGLILQNKTGASSRGIHIRDDCNYVEVTNNIIQGIRVDNRFLNSANVIIVYNTSTSRATNILIRGNVIRSCETGKSEAVQFNGNVDGFLVEYNTITRTGNIGIDIAGGRGVCPDPTQDVARNGIIRGNIVSHCHSPYDRSAAAIYSDGGSDLLFEYNVSHNNDHGLCAGNEMPGHNSENIIVRYNTLFNNRRSGLILGGSSSGGDVLNVDAYGNTCYRNDTEVTTGRWGEISIRKINGARITRNNFHGIKQILHMEYVDDMTYNVTMNYNKVYSATGENNTRFRNYNIDTKTTWSGYKAATGWDTNSTWEPTTVRPKIGEYRKYNPASIVTDDLLLEELNVLNYGYALRKISKLATYAVRVRRSSDNAEMDIGFVSGRLNTYALLNFVGSGGSGYVTTWYSQNSTLHATQTNTTYQPLIVDSGNLIIDVAGNPTMRFDGTNDHLIITNPTTLNNATIGVNAVFKINTLGFYGRILHRGNDSGYGFALRQGGTLGKCLFLSEVISSTENIEYNSAVTTSDWNIATGIGNGTTQNMYKNLTKQTATRTEVTIVGAGNDIHIGARAGSATGASASAMNLSEFVVMKEVTDDYMLEKLVANQRSYYKI
jgi:hypothetical protein